VGEKRASKSWCQGKREEKRATTLGGGKKKIDGKLQNGKNGKPLIEKVKGSRGLGELLERSRKEEKKRGDCKRRIGVGVVAGWTGKKKNR